MVKICYCTTVSITLKTFVLQSAKFLHKEAGWDISFICDEDKEFGNLLPEYIHYYPVKMRRGINFDGFKAVCEIYKICRREKFDLIQYSTPNASLYASIASKIAGTPTRLYCQWGIAYVGFTGIKRAVFKAIEKTVCGLSTWIEPDSKSNLEFAHQERLYPESKGSVVWNGSACGVNLEKFDISKKEKYRSTIRKKYGIRDDAFVYGFVGRVTRDKGVNELLETFKLMSEDSFLLMVGPSEVDETIDSELYRWSEKCDKVIYTGYTDVVEQYLSAMDCYVLPSYREGFGMGVVEAEAMGVPVIVTNIPGPKDAMLHGKTGLIVEKADTKGLHEAMKLILSERNKYLDKGVLFVKNNFDQNLFFQRMLDDRKILLKKTGDLK